MVASAIGCYGTCIDDDAAVPKMFQCLASHVKVRKNIRSESSLELFGRDIEQRFLRMLLGRVVDQNVELTELVDRHRDRIFAEARVADVACQSNTLPAKLLNSFLCSARIVMLVQVHDRDV